LVRIDQTWLARNGGFAPINLPLSMVAGDVIFQNWLLDCRSCSSSLLKELANLRRERLPAVLDQGTVSFIKLLHPGK